MVIGGDHRASLGSLVLHQVEYVFFTDVTLERGEGSELIPADLALEHAPVHPRCGRRVVRDRKSGYVSLVIGGQRQSVV